MIPVARDRLSPKASLAVASAITAVLIAAAAVMRVAVVDAATTPLPDRLIAVLVGACFLLVGLLALPRIPDLGWVPVALGATIGALEVVAVVRSLEPVAPGTAWRDLVFIAALALIGGALVAAGYSNGNRERSSNGARVAMLIVGIGMVSTTATALWAAFDAATLDLASGSAPAEVGELTPLRIAARIALATMAAAIVVGAARQLGPPAVRAAGRLRALPPNVDDGQLWRYLGLLADELVPGRVADRRRTAEAERAQLAADLHAFVLPELRRAASAAASAGAPAEVQLDLRRALEDVEQLMHQRQSIVLEQFGLVAALEWLAERTEERSPIRVHLEIEGDVPDRASAIEPAVARATFRIALLCLDNVVRHASATTATLRISVPGGGLRLVVQDDGQGGSFEGSPGRGLADMRTEAAASGGSIEIVAGPGTRIEAVWRVGPLRGNHVVERADLADRSRPPAR